MDSVHASPSLPLEVCERVIDHIYEASWGYRYSLFACALVCRSWAPRSRFNLFHSVALDLEQSASRFIATVSTSPKLGEYVRELQISLHEQHGQWLYRLLQVLPPLLPNLYRLEYQHLPPLHPLFFVLSSRFSNVKSLAFSYMRGLTFKEIIQVLDRCKSVEKLVLFDCRWTKSGFFASTRGCKLVELHAYEMPPECTNLVSRWSTARSSLSLETVSLVLTLPHPNEPTCLVDLLRRHTSSLRDLSLEIQMLQSVKKGDGDALLSKSPVLC